MTKCRVLLTLTALAAFWGLRNLGFRGGSDSLERQATSDSAMVQLGLNEPSTFFGRDHLRDGAEPLLVQGVLEGNLASIPVTGGVLAQLISSRSGKPVSGVSLALESSYTEASLVQSNFAGEAAFGDVTPGLWKLRCTALGRIQEVDIQPGRVTEIVLEIPEEEGVIQVLDDLGSPISNARVRATRILTKRDIGVSLGRTDDKGEIRVRPLGMGVYVEADTAGYEPSTRRVLSAANPKVELKLRRGGGSVRGKVVDSVAGTPIEGAVVTLGSPESARGELFDGKWYPQASPLRLTTDAEGLFDFEGVGYGFPMIEVIAPGRATWSTRIQVHPQADRGNVFVLVPLSPGLTLVGRVLNNSREPKSGVVVSLKSDSGIQRKATSLEDGTFSFGGLSQSMLHLYARDYETGTQAWQVVELDGSAVIEVMLESAYTIAGRIIDSNGTPMVNASVGQWKGIPGGQGNLKTILRTDSDGQFFTFFDADIEDPILIAVKFPGNAPLPIWVQEVELGNRNVLIVINKSMTLPCKVTARTQFAVRIEQMDWPKSVVYSPLGGGDGRVEVGPLPPGPYKVRLCRSLSDGTEIGVFEIGPGETLDLGDLD